MPSRGPVFGLARRRAASARARRRARAHGDRSSELSGHLRGTRDTRAPARAVRLGQRRAQRTTHGRCSVLGGGPRGGRHQVGAYCAPPEPPCTSVSSGRGPALSGVCFGISIDSSETRGCVPMAARQSVHGMPLMVRALGGVEPERAHTPLTGTWSDAKSSKPRARRGTQALTFGHLPCKRSPSQKRWSDSSLQVEDPLRRPRLGFTINWGVSKPSS